MASSIQSSSQAIQRNRLPDPVMQKVMEYLPNKDLLSASLVCRQWNNMANIAITQGFGGHLFQIEQGNKKTFVYFAQPNYQSPEERLKLNPLLQTVLRKVTMVASDASLPFSSLKLWGHFFPSLFAQWNAKETKEKKERILNHTLKILELKIEKQHYEQLLILLKPYDLDPAKKMEVIFQLLFQSLDRKAHCYQPIEFLLQESQRAHKKMVDLNVAHPDLSQQAFAMQILLKLLETEQGIELFFMAFQKQPFLISAYGLADVFGSDYSKQEIEKRWEKTIYESFECSEEALSKINQSIQAHLKIANDLRRKKATYLEQLIALDLPLQGARKKQKTASGASPNSSEELYLRDDNWRDLEDRFNQAIRDLQTLQNTFKEKKTQQKSIEKILADLRKIDKTRLRNLVNQAVLPFIKNAALFLFCGKDQKTIIATLKKQNTKVVPLKVPLETDRGFCWDLFNPNTGKQGTLYGSLHFMPKNRLKFGSSIMNRFHGSKTTAFEVPLNDPLVIQTFEEHSAELLAKKIASLSLAEKQKLAETVKNKTPSLADIDLSSVDLTVFLTEYFPGLTRQIDKIHGIRSGIDHRLCDIAKELGKPVTGLESLEIHVETLQLLGKLQVKDFQQSFNLNKNWTNCYKQSLRSLMNHINVWSLGNPDLYNLIYPPITFPNGLSRRRDEEMAATIVNLVNAGENPFCVAGAAHMVENNSILEILEKKYNFHITQVFPLQRNKEKLNAMIIKLIGI